MSFTFADGAETGPFLWLLIRWLVATSCRPSALHGGSRGSYLSTVGYATSHIALVNILSSLYSSFGCFAINKAHPVPFLTQWNQFCSNIAQQRQAYFIALHIAVSKLHTFQRFYIQVSVPETSNFLRPLVFLVADQVIWKYVSSIFCPTLYYMSLRNTPEPEVQHDLCFTKQK
jgi:hypothetical protein